MTKPPEKKKISVIIPLYNHRKYIKDTISSVLNQTFTGFEIIVIDDGSTDNSGEVVKNIKDPGIKYFYQENSGAHNAINRGIDLAGGEYIAILNSDDLYYSQRLEECLRVVENDSSVSGVFSFIEVIDSDGDFVKIKDSLEDRWVCSNFKTFKEEGNNILWNLFIENFLVTTSNLFCRKSVFKEIGYFRDFRYAHDYDFFLRLAFHCKVHIIESPLLKYRLHGTNTISESVPAVEFENSLVLADFFSSYDLKRKFGDEEENLMLNFFNSINTLRTSRLIIPFFVFMMQDKVEKNEIFHMLKNNPENFFRKNFMAREEFVYQNRLDYEEGLREDEELYLSLYRDAGRSRKMALLFPFRLMWFFMPARLKKIIKKLFFYNRFINFFFPHRVSGNEK